MMLVDSSVWIDFFNGRVTAATTLLDRELEHGWVATGDLMVAEVLQGFRSDKAFHQARQLFRTIPILKLNSCGNNQGTSP